MDRGAFTGTDPQYVLAISYPVETVYHDLGGNGLFEPTNKASMIGKTIIVTFVCSNLKQIWAARSPVFLCSSTKRAADRDR